MIHIKPMKNQKEYRLALKKIEQLMDAHPDSAEINERKSKQLKQSRLKS